MDILVALDLTEIDETLLKYTSMFINHFHVDTVYFIHIAKSLEIPEDLLEQYPDLIAPMDEAIEKQIAESLEQQRIKKTWIFS